MVYNVVNIVALSYFVTNIVLIEFGGKSSKIYIGQIIYERLVAGVYNKFLGIKKSDTHTQLNGCNAFQDEIFAITQVLAILSNRFLPKATLTASLIWKSECGRIPKTLEEYIPFCWVPAYSDIA